MKKIWVILIIGIFLVGSFFIFNKVTGKAIQDNDVVIPLSEISAENAKWYESNGIKFFVIKAENGVKTAFDACDVCYSSNKGYRQERDYMVCNNCGNRYPISGLGTENKRAGGCWPGYLPSKIEGDNLIIKAKDIEKGDYRFK